MSVQARLARTLDVGRTEVGERSSLRWSTQGARATSGCEAVHHVQKVVILEDRVSVEEVRDSPVRRSDSIHRNGL